MIIQIGSEESPCKTEMRIKVYLKGGQRASPLMFSEWSMRYTKPKDVPHQVLEFFGALQRCPLVISHMDCWKKNIYHLVI